MSIKKNSLRVTFRILFYFLVFILIQESSVAQIENLASAIHKNNIICKTVGGSSQASMPLGNGDIGLNVWTEADGNICFSISKTDAWGENGRLLKIGKVVINVSPAGCRNIWIVTTSLHGLYRN